MAKSSAVFKAFGIVAVWAMVVPPAIAQDEFGGAQPGEGAETAETSAPQVSETHVVQGGDTLWDLCSKYLNSPWYWPKIWSYNPQITNPHWIYPGNEVRFYPSDENLPTNIEVGRAMSMSGDDEAIPDELDPDELVTTVGSISVGRTAPDSVFTTFVSFVSKTAHARAGQIVNAESEAYLLSDYDRTYVKLKSAAKKGEPYAIYRTVRAVTHPISGELYGYAVEIVGGVQIVDTSPQMATAQIAQAYRPIERGDYIGPWPEDFGGRVKPSPNQTETQGYIIETVGDVLGPVGQHHMVFIDRGRSHGVQRGNIFAVVGRGDGYTRETAGLPNEDIGQLMVLDVQDTASTAIITYAIHEVTVGEKVVMRKM